MLAKKVKEVITFTAVGDIMLGEHPVRLGNGVRSHIEKLGGEYLFSKVVTLWNDSDIVFGNLEVALSDIGLIKGRLESEEFRGSTNSIPLLKEAGFNVLGISNNHCMEHGINAFQETTDLLQGHGIFVAGLKGQDSRCIPYEIIINNIKVFLLSYSLRSENYYKGGLIPYTLASENQIIEEVRYFKIKSDFLIVSLHWGEEFMDYPSPEHVIFAHKLVDTGANLIIGHHPHVLQGVEKYKNSVIVYSLGNFVFDMWQKKTRKTVIFKAKFSKQGISSVELIPIHINDFFQPEPLISKLREYFLYEIEKLDNLILTNYKNIDNCTNKDIELMEKQYLKLAYKKTIQHRIGNYLYFLAHIYRYKPSIIVLSLTRSFLRRLEELKGLFY